MFKKLIVVLTFLISFFASKSQDSPDELRSKLIKADKDSSLVSVLDKMIVYYREKNRDSAIHYINMAIAVSEKNNQLLMPLWYKTMYCNQLLGKQQFAAAYKLLNENERKVSDLNEQNSTWKVNSNLSYEQNKHLLIASIYYNFQILMNQTTINDQVRYYITKTKENAQLSSYNRFNTGATSALAFLLIRLNKPDSAILILNSINHYDSVSIYFKDFDNMLRGFAYSDLHQYQKSNQSLHLAMLEKNSKNIATRSALRLSQNYFQLNKIDSAYHYARYLLDTLTSFGFSNFEIDLGVAYKNMYECFSKMNKRDSAFKYAQLALRAQDSLNTIRIKNLSEFQQLLLTENKRIEALEDSRNEKIARWTNLGALSFAILIGIIALLLFRNVRQSKTANTSLVEQKDKLQQTLDQLQSTQSQLVQSEKMASLGELTAGIAHEIQNPLNFVNNFAEVNVELIDELETEANKGNLEEVKLLAKDIKENESKVNFHGKRADAIVKGMLQHSRTSTGQKEPTDINALCDEYLRLSYHGLRAKDKSFNAEFDLHLDPSLTKVNVVPQDMGRVLLNLINNAFYAVNEKSKKVIEGYRPKVQLTTRRMGDRIEISVEDNGMGIPDAIKEKIFQPFFTTKPTGEGTGLGLSLSYDIMKKHGGELVAETRVGESTCFTLRLPIW